MSKLNMFAMPKISGSMYSYLKNTELKMKFTQKQENPNIVKTEKQKEIEKIQRDMVSIREGNVVSSLDAKLRGGISLTDEELEYLKEKNPDLYEKAIEIKKEREKYKKELEKCRTKDDVEKLHSHKMQRFMSEIKSVSSNPNIDEGKKREIMEQINRRAMGILSEHTNFIKSKEYEKLPTEKEINEKKKKPIKDKTIEEPASDIITDQMKLEMLKHGITMEDINAVFLGIDNKIENTNTNSTNANTKNEFSYNAKGEKSKITSIDIKIVSNAINQKV